MEIGRGPVGIRAASSLHRSINFFDEAIPRQLTAPISFSARKRAPKRGSGRGLFLGEGRYSAQHKGHLKFLARGIDIERAMMAKLSSS